MRALFVSQWSRFTAWLWQDFLAPRHKWRFKARIALRVNWLFFKRWWRETVSLGGLLRGLRRPTVLLLIGLGLPILMIWLIPFGEWVTPVTKDGAVQLTDQLAWKELIQPLLILIGVPSAFILWAFRDHNSKSALENQRKDINLKEFQEIQLRAAGGLDEKLPAKARETLQVAAIHQLRPFLRGEYGTSFRRPAWELLKALLATSAETSGYDAIWEWGERGGFPEVEGESAAQRAEKNAWDIEDKILAIRPDVVALASRTLVSEEAGRLFRADLPLERGRFDGVNLSGALLARQNFLSAYFVGANLSRAHLEGANLNHAHLEGGNLSHAHLEGASLWFAHLEGADLKHAHLEDAKLFVTHLDGADLRGAYLAGVDINGVCLDGAILSSACFDDDTRFAHNWDALTETEREAARKPWRDQGMIHVDEVGKR